MKDTGTVDYCKKIIHGMITMTTLESEKGSVEGGLVETLVNVVEVTYITTYGMSDLLRNE